MDKALVFGTKDCRFESCQGHAIGNARIATPHAGLLEFTRRCSCHTGEPTRSEVNSVLGSCHTLDHAGQHKTAGVRIFGPTRPPFPRGLCAVVHTAGLPGMIACRAVRSESAIV